ncbi:MAG: response regulator [Thermodesulfobacteriota bacterium]
MCDCKVLIIDDEKILCDLFSMALQRAGYKVYQATTAQDALKLMAETPCQIIFMDINLPDMDGLDLARKLRQGEPLLQINAITGNLPWLEERMAEDSPFVDLLGKPLEIKDLLTAAAASWARLKKLGVAGGG